VVDGVRAEDRCCWCEREASRGYVFDTAPWLSQRHESSKGNKGRLPMKSNEVERDPSCGTVMNACLLPSHALFAGESGGRRGPLRGFVSQPQHQRREGYHGLTGDKHSATTRNVQHIISIVIGIRSETVVPALLQQETAVPTGRGILCTRMGESDD